MSNPLNNFFAYLRNSALIKICFIGFLIIILLIPLALVGNLIYEREDRFHEAIFEVSSKWGNQQTIVGPILSIPYQTRDKNNQITTHQAYFLPEKLDYNGTITPEIRSRGIYEVPLYKVQVQTEADFSSLNFSEMNIAERDVLWNEASISIAIPDMRGIKQDLTFSWNQQELKFKPGTNLPQEILRSGVQAAIPNLKQTKSENLHFSFSLELNGSDSFFLAPLGKQTTATLKSDWESPNFTGNFLPNDHTLDKDGFDANWDISYFSRSYPQQWKSSDSHRGDFSYAIESSSFGVNLLMPVDFYQQNTRSVKYGILFILLTFTVFFLFEVINKLRIHPIQYLFVGFSMCVFYLLLLSLSEHIDFAPAYTISSVSTIALITIYSIKVLRKKSSSIIMGLFLTALYIYLYILLQQQDYALLIGSISLFIFLALVMYLTRNIDWYLVKNNQE